MPREGRYQKLISQILVDSLEFIKTDGRGFEENQNSGETKFQGDSMTQRTVEVIVKVVTELFDWGINFLKEKRTDKDIRKTDSKKTK